MCGIIAYNGQDNAVPYLMDGIRNLEYRGYDSCGCVLDGNNNKLIIKKDTGRIDEVIKKYDIGKYSSTRGIFHTRWGTIGDITKENAHPFADCMEKIAVAHNGIIENWEELKAGLMAHKFKSDTDTEVLVHFLEEKLKEGLPIEDAVKLLFSKIKGLSSFVIMDKDSDDLIAVKNGSPLVLGISKNGTFVSSDVPSFLKYTNKVIYLMDGDMVRISKSGYAIDNLLDNKMKHQVSTVNFSIKDIEKGRHKHFMIKEILEQPNLIRKFESTDFSKVYAAADLVKSARTVYILGAGTSHYAGMLGAKFFLENGIQAVPIQGQEILTYLKVISPRDVFIIISQSGETADIISALPLIKNNKKIGLINNESSTIAREVDIFIDIGAGPEKAVASTKAFTLSSLYTAFIAMAASGRINEAFKDLRLLNLNMYNLLVPSVNRAIDTAAEKLKEMDDVFYLGRDHDYVLCMEGALKLKEIAYVHAEAIDAATFKHGPLALISSDKYSIALVSNRFRDATTHNLEEVKARKGKIIGISDKPSNTFDMFIRIPDAGMFTFVFQAMALQLLAYKTSLLKGIDCDHPRNLAKAVTVK